MISLKKYTSSFSIAFIMLFILASCKQKTNSSVLSDNEGFDKNLTNNNYDWTGTYELKDTDYTYTLKLHKRSVDASYEMQFYNNSNNEEILKSALYDAKDDSNSIYIKFLNNYTMDASTLDFKSGDTLFVLHHTNENDSTFFVSFKPKGKSLNWQKVSEKYN